jgi:hypothetical protein
LTEEIGARRRELYALDTFKPIDEKFTWTYDKSPLKLNLNSKPVSKHSQSESMNTLQSAARLTSPSEKVIDYESVLIGRRLDMWVTRATSDSKWMTQPNIDSVIAEIRSGYVGTVSASTRQLTLEDYICLYNKYMMGQSLTKLGGSLKDASTLNVIDHYHSFIVHPDPADLQAARNFIDGTELSSIPQTLWPAYLISTCFLHHPIVNRLVESGPTLTDSDIKTCALSKKALKALRTSLPSFVREFLSDILRAPSVALSRPQVYRTQLVIDRARACGDTEQILALEKVVTPETMKSFDFDFLITSNTAFKNSLFS